MALFLTIAEGTRADRARPIVATGDARVIRSALQAIERLGDALDVPEVSKGDGGASAAVLPFPLSRREEVRS